MLFLTFLIGISANTINAQEKKKTQQQHETNKKSKYQKDLRKLREQQNVFVGESADNEKPRSLNIGLPGISTRLAYSGMYLKYFNDFGREYVFNHRILSGQKELVNRKDCFIEYGYPGYIVNYIPAEVKTGGNITMGMSNRRTKFMDASFIQELKKGWYMGLGVAYRDQRGPYILPDNRKSTRDDHFKARIGKIFNRGSISMDIYTNRFNNEGTKSLAIYNEDGSISQYNNFDLSKDQYFPPLTEVLTVDPHTQKRVSNSKISGVNNKSVGADLDFKYTFKSGIKLRSTSRYTHVDRSGNNTAPNGLLLDHKKALKKFAKGMKNAKFIFNDTQEDVPQDLYFGIIKNTIEEPVAINQFFNNLILEKETGNHRIRGGLNFKFSQALNLNRYQDNFISVWDGNNVRIVDVIDPSGTSYTERGKIVYNGQYRAMDGNFYNYSIYLKDDWQLNKNLQLSAGVRFDYFKDKYTKALKSNMTSNTSHPLANKVVKVNVLKDNAEFFTFDDDYSATSAFLGFDYTHNALRIEGAVSKAFSNQQFKNALNPSPDINTSDLNDIYTADFNIGIVKAKYGFRTGISYVSRKNNFLLVQMEEGAVGNLHDIETLGMTVNSFIRPLKKIEFIAQFTYQDPKYKDYIIPAEASDTGEDLVFSGNMPTGISKVIIEFTANWKITSKLKAMATLRYNSKKTLDENNFFYSDPYFFSTAGVTYKINKRLNLKYKINNITNRIAPKSFTGLATLTPEQIPSVYGKPIFITTNSPRLHAFSATYSF